MNPRYYDYARDRFDLKQYIRDLVRLLLRSSGRQATLYKISKKLRCDTKSLRMDIAIQIQKYPTIHYDSENDLVMLTSKSFPLFVVITNALEGTKKLFFFPKRLEKMLYEVAAKSKDANGFWDKIQTLINFSDPLSSFLLRHFVGIATLRFGPLGSPCSEDAVQWATTIAVSSNGRYAKRFKLLATHSTDPKFRTCISFIRMNPVFLKDDTKENGSIDREKIVLLENLGIISFNHERQMYSLALPLIYPWNLNSYAVRFLMTEDYRKRIYRDFGLQFENPISEAGFSNLILNLLKVVRKGDVEPLWGAFSILKDFSSNVVSILYGQDGNISDVFSMKVSLPFSIKDPSVFGEILWALQDIPRTVEFMPFEWFRTVLTKAAETSRLLGIRTGMLDLSDDAAIFCTSSSVAEGISAVARNFGLLLRIEYNECGKTLRFHSRRDLKRIGLISQIGITRKSDEMSVRRFLFEILNEVLRTRPWHTILLRQLAATLEVDPDFLSNFVKTYLSNSVDLSIPGQVSPLKDPWLEVGTK